MGVFFDLCRAMPRGVADFMFPEHFSQPSNLPMPIFPEVKATFTRNLNWLVMGGAICIALVILKIIKVVASKIAERDQLHFTPDLKGLPDVKHATSSESNKKIISNVIPICNNVPRGNEASGDAVGVSAHSAQPGSEESQNSQFIHELERKNEEEETPGGPDSFYRSMIQFETKPIPTGVVNFDQNSKLLNVCYLTSTLQLLRIGFESRINALTTGESAEEESKDLALKLQPVIKKISEGEEAVNAAEIMHLARYVIDKKMVDKQLYEQACSIELMQAMLDKLNVSLFPIQKGYQGHELLQKEDASHLMLNLKHSDKVASCLDDALKFWATSEPYDGQVQVNRLQAQSLPDTLIVILNRHAASGFPEPIDYQVESEEDADLQRALMLSASEVSGKISDPVEMPNIWQLSDDYLDVGPILGEPRPEYQLHGFIVHSGESEKSGHYYAYTLESDNQWYCLNDDKVTKMDFESAKLKKDQNTGLIYLYKKVAHADNYKVVDPRSEIIEL